MQLTPEEKRLLTPLAFFAHTLARESAAKNGAKSPCWLCTDEGIRNRALAKAEEFIRNKSAFPNTVNVESVAEKAASKFISAWIEAELEYKKERDAGNPQAFFAPIV